MIIYQVTTPQITEAEQLGSTERGEGSFGSIGLSSLASVGNTMARVNKAEDDACHHIMLSDGVKLYNIWLSTDPFQNRLSLQIDVKGHHPTLGMITEKSHHQGRVQLIDTIKGTPASRIPRWRSTIKRAILLMIIGQPITLEDTLTQAVAEAWKRGLLHATCEFATISRYALHPQEGSLNLNYDQLNVIAKYLISA
jgi:hypothetical protein